MTITALPTPPLRSDGPATFADRGDAFMAALPTFVTEANALQDDVNAKQASAAGSAAYVASVSSISLAGTNYKGLWTALTGALNMPASVYHSGQFWALNTNLANVTTDTPGVSVNWTRIKTGPDTYAYDSRATLRSLTPSAGDQAIVDGLGYFVWQAGSTEPDDDESAFATASGVWLLEAAHWDLVDSWQAPDAQMLADTEIIHGSATCAITSVANVSSASFTGTVTGAAVGNRVIATPPAQLGSTAADTGCLSYHAWVSTANTVTIMLTNASAAAATTNTAIQTAWPITVIKS